MLMGSGFHRSPQHSRASSATSPSRPNVDNRVRVPSESGFRAGHDFLGTYRTCSFTCNAPVLGLYLDDPTADKLARGSEDLDTQVGEPGQELMSLTKRSARQNDSGKVRRRLGSVGDDCAPDGNSCRAVGDDEDPNAIDGRSEDLGVAATGLDQKASLLRRVEGAVDEMEVRYRQGNTFHKGLTEFRVECRRRY